MYEKFYGLSVDPFRLSPDYRFSFSHSSYAKAKAYIQYALHRAEGFVMITGKPGTGKTTLVNEVLHGLSRSEVVVATLVSTQLEADDLLRMVAYSFGCNTDAPQKALVLQRVMDFLVRQHREGRRALLIIDEAQDLSVSALEELRLLTNLQRGGRPLLQIVLLGQEPLRDLVRGPNMEQVHQRLVAACDLEPLGFIDTLAYVQHRLERAGWRGDPGINREVWPLLYELSRGVPRRINLVCSRLMLHGCVEERHTLTANDAALVAAELQQEELAPMESGVDTELPPARMSAGRKSTQQGRQTRDQAQEGGSGRAIEEPGKMSTDRLWALLDDEIAWKLAGRREIGDTARVPGVAQDAAPAVVGDPQGSSASMEAERPDRVPSPHGQRAMGYPAMEEPGPHGRTGSRDGLPGDSESRFGASQSQRAERLSGLDNGSGEEATQVPRGNQGPRGGPWEGAVDAADANVPAWPAESEDRVRATRRAGYKRPRVARARNAWRTIASLALGVVTLVVAVFYFRPNALERELAWLEERTAAIPQKARALFVRLTRVDSEGGHEDRYEQRGRGFSESARAGAQRDHNVAAGGGTVTHPASQNGGRMGSGGEALAGPTGPPPPKPSSATEEGFGDRRIGTEAPTDGSRAIEE